MSINPRPYTSRRQSIVTALVEKLKEIDGTLDYVSDLHRNVFPRLLFWDEVTDFPSVHLNAGSETREYQGDGYKDRFLSLTIRIYVQEEDASVALDAVMEDIETVVEANSRLAYLDKQGNTQFTHQMTIIRIDTDEGVLEPLGIGEIVVEVRY